MQKIDIDRRLVLPLLIMSLAAAIILVVTPFQIKSFFSISLNRGKLKKQINSALRDINSKNRFILEKKEIAKEIVALKSKIVTLQDLSTLQAYISDKAKENGLDITEIVVEPYLASGKSEKKAFFPLPINIKFRSGFHALGHFLDDMEQGVYSLMTEKITIQGSKPYHGVSMEVVVQVEK